MATFRGARIVADKGAAAGPPEKRAAAATSQVRAEFGTRVGLAAIAPAAEEGFGPGTVFFAADVDGVHHTEKIQQPPDRRRMREFSVISLLNLLRRTLSA